MATLGRFVPRARATFQRSVSTLLMGVHENGRLDKATLHACAAAMQLGGSVDVLVAGTKAADAGAEAAKIEGVAKVFVGGDVSSDTHATMVCNLHAKHGYSHVMGPSAAEVKDVLPRAAALIDSQPIGDILAVKDENTFVRAMYAGNAIVTVRSKDTTKVLTVRTTAFPAHPTGAGTAAVETIDVAGEPLSQCVEVRAQKSDKPQLTSASRVVAGGRALKSAANFEAVLDPLCTKLGAAMGASRAAVDSGYAPNELQIGQTGKVVAPDLYVAVGISGAIQHLAGMKDSKTIVAINKDPDAPIFQVADIGLVADLFDAVPALTEKL